MMKIPWNKGLKGIHLSPKSEFKSEDVKGENNNNWKGDKVGYMALHSWMLRQHGKAKICEFCNSLKNVEWAKLKDKKYERKRENFIQLCKSCHKKYDVTEQFKIKISTIRKNYWKKRNENIDHGFVRSLRTTPNNRS